jgi:hypothetical protein
MILGFSTIFPKGKGKLSGNKTRFVEKITRSMIKVLDKELDDFIPSCTGMLGYGSEGQFVNKVIHLKPKKHTIRTDEKNRWKVGINIDFFIGVRTKNMFRFAPKLKVKSIQKIEITYNEVVCEKYCSEPAIFIDNKPLNIFQIQDLAVNDGFADESEFCHWFNEDFTGKIIHWTDLKY